MATSLSDAHRSWRVKVFASTWLSYVGFYFCRKPFSATKAAIGIETGWSATTLGNIWAAYLIAYAVGQFVAAGMGTRLGPRKNVLLGMALSILVCLAVGVTLSAPLMMGLLAVNGLAQATGWSGNVGTMAAWFHKHERGRVMGAWSNCFTVGALTSGWVMAWVLGMHDPGQPAPWRLCFFVGAGVLVVVWVQFWLLQRNKPEDVGLSPIDDPVEVDDPPKAGVAPRSGDLEVDDPPKAGVAPRSGDLEVDDPPKAGVDAAKTRAGLGVMGLPEGALTNLLLVAGFYFFAKFIRYAMWSWAAYLLQKNYGLTGARANVYATAFDIMGIPGVFLTGWISDRFFGSRRAGVALMMMIAMTAATAMLIAFGSTGVTIFAVLLGLVGFTLYGPDALLTGAGAMDIGSRRAATFAAAMISGFGSLGAVVQELVIARTYDSRHGALGPIFVLIFGSAALASVFCGILYTRDRRGGRGI